MSKIATILEICLKDIAAEKATVEMCLARYPDLSDELAPLLRAAERAQTIEHPRLLEEAKARIETRLLAAVESMPIARPVSESRLGMARLWRWAAVGLTLFVAFVCFSAVGLGLAAREALPDSPLYPVKRVTEEVWLWLTPARDDPALHLRLAERRLGEIKALAGRGRFDAEVQAALVEETNAALKGAETIPPETSLPLLRDLVQVTEKQEQTLAALIDGASPSQRDRLAQTLQASTAHRARALELMSLLGPPEAPGDSDQAMPTPDPTSTISITILPSWTPVSPGTPSLRSSPTPVMTASLHPSPSPEPTSPGLTVESPVEPTVTKVAEPTATSSLVPPISTATAQSTTTATPWPTESAEPIASATPVPPTATAVPTGQRCVYGRGYWEAHPALWPASSLTLGNETYAQAESLNLLNRSGDGDASLILAPQLIAAKLNVANGADDTAIAHTLTAADAWLAAFTGRLPYSVNPGSTEGQAATALAGTLEQYNNGNLPGGPSSCH